MDYVFSFEATRMLRNVRLTGKKRYVETKQYTSVYVFQSSGENRERKWKRRRRSMNIGRWRAEAEWKGLNRSRWWTRRRCVWVGGTSGWWGSGRFFCPFFRLLGTSLVKLLALHFGKWVQSGQCFNYMSLVWTFPQPMEQREWETLV